MARTNPLKLDPTRTTTARRAFIADMARRFRKLRRAIRQLVVEEDAFALKPENKVGSPLVDGTVLGLDRVLTGNTRFKFDSDAGKLESYRAWLAQQVDNSILETTAAGDPWTHKYIQPAYKKGMVRAWNDTNKAKGLGFIQGGQDAFLDMSFAGPVGVSKLKTLSTRNFTLLKGITADMDKEMSIVLAQGLAAGDGAEKVAKALTKSVDGLEIKRARAIARTEIVHAHAEGQLDSFEAMNVENVGVMAEWHTAADGRVCAMCHPLQGIVLTVQEARGMIPRHPNCRCAWLPANVGEEKGGTTTKQFTGPGQGLSPPGTLPTGKKVGQSFSKVELALRIRQSVKAEHPKLAAKAARKASKWRGADLTVTGKLKPGSKAHLVAKAVKTRAKVKAATKAKAVATKAKAKADAVHSLKIKTGMTKKKFGLTDADLFLAPGGKVPTLHHQGLENYIAKHGVQLGDAEKGLIFSTKAPHGSGKAHLTAQMEKLDEIVQAKLAAKAEGIHADANAAAAVKEWGTKLATTPEVLDHADYSILPGWEADPHLSQSYGILIFDKQGRTLMRKPTGEFGGAKWTFAKGGGTKPGTTALAELGEETGHKGQIFDVVPGGFKGGTTKTNYFIGKSGGFDAGLMDAETELTKWMTFDEALSAIAESSSSTVVKRDTAVLHAAYKVTKEAKDAASAEFSLLIGSGSKSLDVAKEAAAKAAHAHKVKLGMAKKHYAKPKFGGGVVPEDWTNPEFPTKLGQSGINKVLGEKGWHTSTIKTETWDALIQADDVVAQKAIIDGLKKAPKGTLHPAGFKPSPPTPKGLPTTAAEVPNEWLLSWGNPSEGLNVTGMQKLAKVGAFADIPQSVQAELFQGGVSVQGQMDIIAKWKTALPPIPKTAAGVPKELIGPSGKFLTPDGVKHYAGVFPTELPSDVANAYIGAKNVVEELKVFARFRKASKTPASAPSFSMPDEFLGVGGVPHLSPKGIKHFSGGSTFGELPKPVQKAFAAAPDLQGEVAVLAKFKTPVATKLPALPTKGAKVPERWTGGGAFLTDDGVKHYTGLSITDINDLFAGGSDDLALAYSSAQTIDEELAVLAKVRKAITKAPKAPKGFPLPKKASDIPKEFKGVGPGQNHLNSAGIKHYTGKDIFELPDTLKDALGDAADAGAQLKLIDAFKNPVAGAKDVLIDGPKLKALLKSQGWSAAEAGQITDLTMLEKTFARQVRVLRKEHGVETFLTRAELESVTTLGKELPKVKALRPRVGLPIPTLSKIPDKYKISAGPSQGKINAKGIKAYMGKPLTELPEDFIDELGDAGTLSAQLKLMQQQKGAAHIPSFADVPEVFKGTGHNAGKINLQGIKHYMGDPLHTFPTEFIDALANADDLAAQLRIMQAHKLKPVRLVPISPDPDDVPSNFINKNTEGLNNEGVKAYTGKDLEDLPPHIKEAFKDAASTVEHPMEDQLDILQDYVDDFAAPKKGPTPIPDGRRDAIPANFVQPGSDKLNGTGIKAYTGKDFHELPNDLQNALIDEQLPGQLAAIKTHLSEVKAQTKARLVPIATDPDDVPSSFIKKSTDSLNNKAVKAYTGKDLDDLPGHVQEQFRDVEGFGNGMEAQLEVLSDYLDEIALKDLDKAALRAPLAPGHLIPVPDDLKVPAKFKDPVTGKLNKDAIKAYTGGDLEDLPSWVVDEFDNTDVTGQMDVLKRHMANPNSDIVPTARTPFPVPAEGSLTKIKDLPGSTKPWLGKDPQGKQWVVKDVSGSGIAPDHLRSEALADELYRIMGHAVPDGSVLDAAGGPMKITEFLDGGQTLAEWKAGKSVTEINKMHKQIRKGFVSDTLLANHDVAGLSNDNIFIVAGKAYRIDNGGAMAFRAQGGAKRGWDGIVDELKTMRDKKLNGNTAAIYKGITKVEIDDQIRGILQQREQILAAIPDADLRAVMAARIDDLKSRLPATAARKASPTGVRRAEYVVTPRTTKRVKAARSNGVNVAGDKDLIEDNNILIWEEDAIGKGKVTKVQMKVTQKGSKVIEQGLGEEIQAARATAPVEVASNVHPEDVFWDTTLKSAKTVNHHQGDGKYNMDTLAELSELKAKITTKLKTAKGDTKKMLTHYKGAITKIEKAKGSGGTVSQIERYHHVPPKKIAEAPLPRRRDFNVRRDAGIDFRTVKFDKGVGKITRARNKFSTNEAYVIDAGDGIEIKFIPRDGSFQEQQGRALHGTVSITIPEEASEASINKAMQLMDSLGVDTTPPTAAYEEALYLHRGVYLRGKRHYTKDSYQSIWTSTTLTDEQKVVQMKGWIKTNMKIDVDKRPGYDPHGISKHADGSGFRHWERWDITKEEMAQELKGHSLFHSPYDTTQKMLDGVLSSGGEFTSTTGRIRKGVTVGRTGMSSGSDINTGGASYFFTRIKKDTSNSQGIWFRVGALNRQDVVSYSGDKYGRISAIDTRATTAADLRSNARGSSNEAIFKEGLSLDDVDFIRVGSESEKAEILAVFKKHGITTMPDGRPVADIVTTSKAAKQRRKF